MNCELMLTNDTPTYMFNVHKNQLSRQTGSRNLTCPKMLPTIWHTCTYMKFVTKYQRSAINSCWEKCDEKYLGTGRKDRGKTVYPPPVGQGYKNVLWLHLFSLVSIFILWQKPRCSLTIELIVLILPDDFLLLFLPRLCGKERTR